MILRHVETFDKKKKKNVEKMLFVHNSVLFLHTERFRFYVDTLESHLLESLCGRQFETKHTRCVKYICKVIFNLFYF